MADATLVSKTKNNHWKTMMVLPLMTDCYGDEQNFLAKDPSNALELLRMNKQVPILPQIQYENDDDGDDDE